MNSAVNRVLGTLRSAVRQSGGNVTMMFAIAAVPLLLAAGSAIDYVRSARAQTELQSAADGAALAIATASTTVHSEQKQIGVSYFDANFKDTEMAGVQPKIAIAGGVITVSVSYKYPTSFMALAGIDTIDIGASSEVTNGNDSNAEVAMVLDYSLSMVRSNKYIRMRDAATKMIDQLANSKNGTTLKIGLVPFSAMVRGSMPAAYVSQASATGTWTGCTQDRKNPYNLGVSTPDGSPDSLWGYYDNSENAVPRNCAAYASNNLDIMPLTGDLDAVKAKLGTMMPVGNTDIPLGVEFGWNLLDPDAPYTEGVPYSDGSTKKFMVLLTDGVQTSKQWGADGSRTVANGNDNLVSICGNMEKKGITMFAVAYDITDPKVTTLLKQCAGTNYFEASTSGNEIDTVFKAITLRIKKSTLRLAR